MESRTATDSSLLGLVEFSRWQRLQDHFASVLGIPLRTVSASHELLVNPSWPTGFDADRLIEHLKVGEELEPLIPSTEPPLDISSMTTLLGVTYAATPIRATAEHIIAYFVAGPMVVGPRENELQFRDRMSAMGLDSNLIWPRILSLKLYTFASIRSALTLMEEVGTSIVQLAYQAKQLSSILPPGSHADRSVVSYHMDRILHALLEAATLATKADGGSVMVYDAAKETLHVKVAQGLSDAVVSSTRMRSGEGLAGLAVEQRQILVVDRDTTDGRFIGRMNRPELASSLVAPLAPDASSEPIAVLSLRTAQPQRRFTQEHIDVLRSLLALAGIAIGSLRAVFNQARTSASS